MQKAKVQLLSAGLALALVFAEGEGRAANASAVRPLFLVTSYDGKCLDYGPRFRGDRSLAIYLNDCAIAHPIGVQEIDDRHDVVLYADTDVIGIHNPDSNTTTTTGAGTANGLPWTLQQVPIGHFQGGATSEFLVWNQRGLCIVDGMSSNLGVWTLQPWSRQDME
jgi:hypothetical protein